jgi:hypothetical protein
MCGSILRICDCCNCINLWITFILTMFYKNGNRNLIFFSDHYFTSVRWLNANSFFIVWTNRPQNLSVISLCQAPNYECQGVSSLFELFKTEVLNLLVLAYPQIKIVPLCVTPKSDLYPFRVPPNQKFYPNKLLLSFFLICIPCELIMYP